MAKQKPNGKTVEERLALAEIRIELIERMVGQLVTLLHQLTKPVKEHEF